MLEPVNTNLKFFIYGPGVVFVHSLRSIVICMFRWAQAHSLLRAIEHAEKECKKYFDDWESYFFEFNNGVWSRMSEELGLDAYQRVMVLHVVVVETFPMISVRLDFRKGIFDVVSLYDNKTERWTRVDIFNGIQFVEENDGDCFL